MKFDRLKASISNNADEKPSLYMALCAVESLFADLEDNCGKEVSRCPVGDERLPSKLVWLCRVINEIYRDNSEELQRNRSRLDAAMDKLQNTKKELEASSQVAERLASLKAEYAALQRQLERSEEAAEECETLEEQCRQAKRQLEKLSTFDAQTAREDLLRLRGQISQQETAKADLLGQLQQADACVGDLRREVEALQAKEQDMRSQYRNLQQLGQQSREETARLQAQMQAAQQEFAATKAEGQQLVDQREEVKAKIAVLREKIEEFREDNLATKCVELETVQQELQALEAQRHTADDECCRMKEQRSQLVMDIARQKVENEALQEKLALSRQKREGLEAEKAALSTDLSDCLQMLETLQTDVELLTQKRLPEAKALCQQEQLRQTQLREQVEQAQSQNATLQEEIEKLNALLPSLEEEVKNNRVVYDALTASCAASSSELESLERQIAELRNNSDEQKLVIYRKQLEENQQELEKIQAECQHIKDENQQLGEKLEQMQNERARLQELKNRHEQGVLVSQKQLQELEAVATEKYMQEVLELDGRTKLLESVRSKLAASIADMHKILGHTPVEEPISLEERMKNDLRAMQQRIDDLRGALVACAQSLKMEER